MKDSRILRAFTFLAVLSISECKCSNERDFNRHFYMDGRDHPLLIEVSTRVNHQLVSNILQILLTEAMGYSDVRLVQQDERYANGNSALMTLEKITHCSDPKTCAPQSSTPEVMINLEMWLAPDFNMELWVNTERVDDCGSFGPMGRSGWFIPSYTVEYYWTSNGTIVDHWREFQKPEVSKEFDLTLDSSFDRIMPKETRLKLCPHKNECGTDGVYRPVQCRSDKDVRCATILSDFPESTLDGLRKIINGKEPLLVNVVWLGGNFKKVVENLLVSKKHFIIVHKMPSFLSTLEEFIPVSFPSCNNSCDYGVNTLRKVAWSKIRSHAPHAYHVIRAMSFTQEAYLQLLNLYKYEKSRGYDIYDVACQWVKTHEVQWLSWVPGDFTNKTALYIGGIFPLTGTYWKQSGVTVAAEMAVKAINKDEKILGKYNLEILEQDGHCAADEVMKSFISYVTSSTYSNMIGILGPACSDTVEPVAGVAKHFNTIIMSYSAEGALFSNREKYPYFFRTIPENNLFRYVYMKLFKKLGWKRVAALTEDGQKYPEYLSYLQDLMQANELTFIVNRKFPRERTSLDMKPYLMDLKNKGARIIIGDFYDSSARAIMCDAYKLQMTASHGYQWFLPLWFTADWFNTDKQRSDTNTTITEQQVSCTTEQMVEAINGHMSLSYKYYADQNCKMQENITVGEWYNQYKEVAIKQKKEPSQYAGYTYDAVWVYATAMDALLKENDSHVSTLHSKKTSRRLVQLLNETNMNGVSGLLSSMGSSRISDVIIWQWVDNKTNKVGMYHAINQNEGNLILNEKHIVWLTRNGQRPGDGGGAGSDECALDGLRTLLNSTCETAIIVVNVLGFLVFAVLVMMAVAVFKFRYDRRIRLTEERIKELGLASGCVPFALDEWEMAREHIVVNRKLGEGAFGTVFGGEAMVNSGGWVAVAVKTLKAGAKSEEKLDFLSEAEVMKQFDHRNIVKLIGVCTTGEPVYTIMEFMLYGDLKTYLLSRRHLVSDKDRQNSPEVSNRKLTSMALDIARGLSYLADLKFVHRDLACRNCLVNSARSVKIADFGMCRAMYDSDYYRYNKKGMLPVRWMAPESLIDGLFTPMSDVWSFGVILFEIVTFASFPYQGLSNAQVLERIKRFDTLQVPHGCSPELTGLFLQCWSRNEQARPPAAEIVEILANHPELISPSLDTPTASVEPEDSDSLDISIHDHTRHHSFSYIWQNRRKAASMDQTEPRLVDSPKAEKSYKKQVSKHIAMATFPNRKLSFPYETMLSQTPEGSYLEKVVVEDIPQVTYL